YFHSIDHFGSCWYCYLAAEGRARIGFDLLGRYIVSRPSGKNRLLPVHDVLHGLIEAPSRSPVKLLCRFVTIQLQKAGFMRGVLRWIDFDAPRAPSCYQFFRKLQNGLNRIRLRTEVP